MTIRAQEDRGRAAIASLPDCVRVGPFDFIINKMTENRSVAESKYGYCNTIEHEIALKINMPSSQMAVGVLIHEINHAIYWSYGIQDDDKEERICGTMSTAMVQVFRDNPWLAGWIGAWVHPA